MAITKVGINLSGVVGALRSSKIRDWISAQPSDARCADTAGCRIYLRMSPRREWLDEVTGGRSMYLLSRRTRLLVQHRSDADGGRRPGIHPILIRDPSTVRDSDGTPNGHAVEGAYLDRDSAR